MHPATPSSTSAKAMLLLLMLISALQPPAIAADRLRLVPGISYHSDLGKEFPIASKNRDDTSLATDKSTLIFFGAIGDLNTNRQARRLVQLYQSNPSAAKFIVINVDQPADEAAKRLIRTYYKGYVPSQVIVAPNGNILSDTIGEVSKRKLQAGITKFN